jgi:hypothetical protein
VIVSTVAHGCICSKSTAKPPLQVAVTDRTIPASRPQTLLPWYPAIAAIFGMFVPAKVHGDKAPTLNLYPARAWVKLDLHETASCLLQPRGE